MQRQKEYTRVDEIPMNNPNHPEQVSTQPIESSVDLIVLVYRLIDKAILILLATILGALLMGKIAGTSAVTTYYSTAKLYLINTNDTMLSMSDLQAANNLVYDYLALFQTKELHQRVADSLPLHYTADQLSAMVSAGNLTDTHIISITVRATSAEDAETIAHAYATVTGTLVEEKLNVPKPVLFEDATPAVKTVTSNAKQNYIIGAMVGLFVSCVAVILYGIFDDHVYTPEDADLLFLGILTKQKKHGKRRNVCP